MVSGEQETLQRLKDLIGFRAADVWLDEARVTKSGRKRILRVGGPFQKRWLETHCADALTAAFGGKVEVVARETPARPAPRVAPRLGGPAGEFALRMVRAFVEGGLAAAGLVVLHGPAHSGKSLLVDWACSLGGRRVFRLDLARLRAGRSRGFIPRKPLLVGDGIELLAGKAAGQRSLRIILDALHDRGDRVLVTLEGHPGRFDDFFPALRNRLLGGVLVPLELPGPAEIRLQLREHARRRGRRLPGAWEDELSHLAPADALRALDLRLAGKETEPAHPIDRMKDVAARLFGIERELLDRPVKRRSVVEARRAVMAAARLAGFEPARIAGAFGLQSQRTVREACRWAAHEEERDRRFAALLHEVRRVAAAR